MSPFVHGRHGRRQHPRVLRGATATKCVPVTLAASDVAASSFQEKSWGATNGPQGGGVLTWANRNFAGLSTTVPNVLSSQNPIIVPYGFFANNSIKRSNDYPVGGPAPGPADAGWQTISNISRLMAVNIFSGLVTSWKDLGDDFLVVDNTNTEVPGDPIVPCLRHAGSGSHATLDFSVIRGNGWGNNLITKAAANGGKGYFNDGTSQELACINGVGGFNGYGAIGYADADSPIGAVNSLPNVVALTYQGEAPSGSISGTAATISGPWSGSIMIRLIRISQTSSTTRLSLGWKLMPTTRRSLPALLVHPSRISIRRQKR